MSSVLNNAATLGRPELTRSPEGGLGRTLVHDAEVDTHHRALRFLTAGSVE